MDGYGPGGGATGPEDGAPLATPPPARWDGRALAAVALLSFLAAGVASAVAAARLGILRGQPEIRTAEDLFVLTASQDVVLVIAVLALASLFLRIGPADLGVRRVSPAALRHAVTIAAGLWLVATLVNVAQTALLGPHPQPVIVSVGAHSGVGALALDLLTGALVAPFAEELFYRGLLFQGLAQRAPFAVAASVSALLFALAHGLGVAVPIFFLGIGLAYVYRRTGSIFASMTTHGLVNAVSVAALHALARS